jgi:ATP-dependent RNA helicase DHX29
MSATVDAQRFSQYLGGAPILNVPGRTFPVETKYLEDAIELTGHTIDGANQQKTMTDFDDLDVEEAPDSAASRSDAIKTLKDYTSKTRNTISQFDEYRIDYDLVFKLLEKVASDERYVNYSKAILVFLPGIAEIRQLNDILVGHPSFSKGWYIYPLHSTIASEEQERAFLIPPDGVRKIVLATNIAETGITIPDITCVVDTGKHKEMR